MFRKKMPLENKELKRLNWEMKKTGIIVFLPTMLIGLGINAKFANSGVPVHALLENNIIVITLFVVGIAGYMWGVIKILNIRKKIKEIENNRQT